MTLTPTPDDVENVSLLLRWWREFTLLIVGLLLTMAGFQKAKVSAVRPIYLTEEQVKDVLDAHQEAAATSVNKDMQLCKLNLEAGLRKEFYTRMEKNNDALIERFKDMLDART